MAGCRVTISCARLSSCGRRVCGPPRSTLTRPETRFLPSRWPPGCATPPDATSASSFCKSLWRAPPRFFRSLSSPRTRTCSSWMPPRTPSPHRRIQRPSSPWKVPRIPNTCQGPTALTLDFLPPPRKQCSPWRAARAPATSRTPRCAPRRSTRRSSNRPPPRCSTTERSRRTGSSSTPRRARCPTACASSGCRCCCSCRRRTCSATSCARATSCSASSSRCSSSPSRYRRRSSRS
mmetsp:Transcript_43686/g.134905  ORF Transcript_43686/g.134905 Transcript_43686/m.134905 type:complete len:235 (-) Transcript_43686:285-989(-)